MKVKFMVADWRRPPIKCTHGPWPWPWWTPVWFRLSRLAFHKASLVSGWGLWIYTPNGGRRADVYFDRRGVQ